MTSKMETADEWVIAGLRKENAELQTEVALAKRLMQEAIDNCETCESWAGSRCARCRTFQVFLDATK